MLATGSLLLSLVLAASQAHAQLGSLTSNLSTSCQSAATSLISSDFATCSDLIGLVSVISASGSVVTPLNSWMSTVCSSSACSSSTLSSAQSTVSSGCSSDISSGNAIAVALDTIITQYSGIRDMICLEASSNSTLCITEILTNIQTATGTNITVTEVTTLLEEGSTSLVSTLNSVPSSAYCTDCMEAIFTKASAISANASTSTSSANAAASSALSSKCGSWVVSGKIPSTVKEADASSTTSSSSSNSAAGRVVLPAGLAGVAAVLGAMAAGAAMLA